MTKAEIRARVAEQKQRFQNLEPLSIAAVKFLRTWEIFKTARTVGVYMPLSDEVDITPIFQNPEQSFFIPAFDEMSGSYRMARLTPKLKKGRFGIPEPENPVFAAKDEIDLIVVPGLAFDPSGNRIGRGGGFYDRLLPQYSASRAGICFDFQCLKSLPAEEHDARMDWIVTNRQILKTEMNS
jgi:5-formyltetrahydrofolate cyclo-ligase